MEKIDTPQEVHKTNKIVDFAKDAGKKTALAVSGAAFVIGLVAATDAHASSWTRFRDNVEKDTIRVVLGNSNRHIRKGIRRERMRKAKGKSRDKKVVYKTVADIALALANGATRLGK
ncbi:MAG: hypothetical protein GY804_14260 [Alphaproteobacteria bacterium]|nr:hypothetical protein [Alphaproteobacteria bacterium]